jgi:stage V sporulation protein G
MEISDIRVKLMQDAADRLKAVCSITLDDEFVVRDLKVVEGTNGLFVAMPSRKLSVHCPQCRSKNHLRARFCNECGAKLPAPRIPADPAGRIRLHRDIAHPINPAFREIVQTRVIEKYQTELELAQDPDYAPVDLDSEHEEVAEEPGDNHGPSEYDQLIAGLKSGSDAPSEHEPRPPLRNDRPADRRGPNSVPGAAPRPPKRQHSAPPRPAPQRRERDERPVGPPRGRGPTPAPRPAPMVFEPDDAPEERAPAVETRPAAKAEPPPVSRPAPPPAPRRTEVPPPPKTPQPTTIDPEDMPFGAGILSKGEN